MTERMIDVSDEAARLSVRGALLVIQHPESGSETTVPINEVAVLVASNPCITLSHAVLAAMGKSGAVFVACDEKHMPAAMLLPVEGHFSQAERFRQQAAASLPLRKRLWQDLVRAKVRSQGRLLKRVRGKDFGLVALANNVRSGDTGNIEAQASRRYWQALFADSNFRREREAEDQNRLLNYGYMVLRAVVARAICAAGLHPSFGVHHHNRFDAFCLADDLVEPFRSIVDEAVLSLAEKSGAHAPLDKVSKAVLIGSLTGRFAVENESRTLFDILSRTAASLAGVYAGETQKLFLPELMPCPAEP